jgi:hypothetical protein
VLAHIDPDSGKDFVDVVLDQAEQKGTGRWTVQSELDLGVPITGIAEATFARSLSGHAEQRGPAREVFGTDTGEMDISDRDAFVEDVRKALYASKVVAYAQGFDQIKAGSEAFGWNVDRGAMAGIWRGGCIIRARFLDRVRQAYDADPELPSLLVAPTSRTRSRAEWRPGGGSCQPPSRRECQPRRSSHHSPTTTRCGPSDCRPRSSRDCATTSAHTPTSASTGPKPSTSPGPGTASSTPHNDRARSLRRGNDERD